MSKLDEVLNLAKTKGYFWPAYDIYGGVSGLYVLGPNGVRLAEGITQAWRRLFVRPMGFLEVDAPSVTPFDVLKSSGHVDNFKDPMVECTSCHNKYRADHLLEEAGIQIKESASLQDISESLSQNDIGCPNCGSKSWIAQPFSTMFATNIGPYEKDTGFLRPETAQGIFVEFQRLINLNRGKLPLGVAQAGKGFRNEISPRQSIIRLREFHMLEVELFTDPSSQVIQIHDPSIELPLLHESLILKGNNDPENLELGNALSMGIIKNPWLGYFMALSFKLLNELGIPKERQRFKEKLKGERAHYSEQTFDHEIYFDELGWIEVAGHAYRTDYDLKSHMQGSGHDLSVSIELKDPVDVIKRKVNFDLDALKKIYPNVWQKILSGGHIIEGNQVIFDNAPLDKRVYKIIEKVEKERVKKIIPHVIEPSFGLERLMLACLYFAYGIKEDRVILGIPKHLINLTLAIFPLISDDKLIGKAKSVKEELTDMGFEVIYDESGSIGKRYARVDEIGIPLAITIDHQTLEDNTVTLRDRDTWEQIRKKVDELPSYLS